MPKGVYRDKSCLTDRKATLAGLANYPHRVELIRLARLLPRQLAAIEYLMKHGDLPEEYKAVSRQARWSVISILHRHLYPFDQKLDYYRELEATRLKAGKPPFSKRPPQLKSEIEGWLAKVGRELLTLAEGHAYLIQALGLDEENAPSDDTLKRACQEGNLIALNKGSVWLTTRKALREYHKNYRPRIGRRKGINLTTRPDPLCQTLFVTANPDHPAPPPTPPTLPGHHARLGQPPPSA